MKHIASILIIIFSVLFIISVLLKSNSNFFLNDDIISQFLPQIQVQSETVFLYHQLPQINYYHYLGHPLLPQGQFGTFYIPRYFFSWIAWQLGSLEHLVVLEHSFHMILAGVGMYLFLINLHIRRALSVIGAIAFSLNGMMIDVGRNWLMVSGYLAYLPYLYLVLIRYISNGRRPFLSAFIRIILFSLGYTNFFVYICFFELLLFVFLRPNRKDIYTYIFSLLITFIAILPLLFPIFKGLSESNRSSDFYGRFFYSNSFFYLIESFVRLPCYDWFYLICSPLKFTNPLLIPAFVGFIYLLFKKRVHIEQAFLLHCKDVFARIRRFIIHFKFLFTLLIVFFVFISVFTFAIDVLAFLLFLYLIRYKKSPSSLYFWGFFCLLMIGLSMGIKSLSTFIFFPVVLFFRWPWKWYIVGQFLLTVFAVLFFHKYFKFRIWGIGALYVFIVLFIVYTSLNASYSYNVYFKPFNTQGDLSYIDPLKSGRMVAVGSISKEGIFSELLADNVGSYFKVHTFSGYDPLVPREKSSLVVLEHDQPLLVTDEDYYNLSSTLKEYGVKSYLIDRDSYDSFSFFKNSRFQKVFEDERFLIYSDSEALPLVYDQNLNTVPFTIRGNSIMVDLSGSTVSQLTVNYFARDKGWKVYVDSKPYPLTTDSYKRIVVDILSGSRSVEVRYEDQEFLYGIWTMIGSSILLIPLYFLVYRKLINKR